jgi:protein TonB
MFDYMLESSSARRGNRNPWAFFLSMVVQTIVIFVVVLIPLLYTEALPKQAMMSWLVAPPPPPPPPPPPRAAPVKRIIRRVTQMQQGKLRAPTKIPKKVAIIEEEATPAGAFGVVGGVPGGVPGGQMGGVLGGVLGGVSGPVAPPPPPPKRIRVSQGVQEAKMIRRVQPRFPPIAKQARIQGTVQLEAIIAKDGTIQNLRVIKGHPLLAQAAIDAVSQWRYEPTLLNNLPVEVVTLVNVIFKLN